MERDKKKILIVDDEPKVMRFVEISLKLRGFEVHTMTSGKQAIDLFSYLQPHLVLLDMIMPEVSGLDVLKSIRSHSEVPVIAYSASELNQPLALNSGANEFITKPFYPTDLVNRIDSLVNRSY